jgi:hypothetical protein
VSSKSLRRQSDKSQHHQSAKGLRHLYRSRSQFHRERRGGEIPAFVFAVAVVFVFLPLFLLSLFSCHPSVKREDLLLLLYCFSPPKYFSAFSAQNRISKLIAT